MKTGNSKKKLIKPILAGVIGMLALVIVYWLVLYLSSGDINHPWQQFIQFKYWISALLLGFGIQFGLYWYVKSGMHLSGKAAKTAVATGATTSTVSMVACCAHHIFDILPLLGLSVAALFLSKYQTYFFALGIISNLIGIYMMFYIIKYKRTPKIFNKIKLKKIENKNKTGETSSKKPNNKFIILAIVILILSIVLILNKKSSENNSDSGNNVKSGNGEELIRKHQTKTDEQVSVTVDVTPRKLGLAEEKNIFEVSLNTHSADLSYDFQKIIVLKDDLGNIYQAFEWTGGEGGHHMSGEIIFPKLDSSAKKVELTIDGVGGVTRVFEWML